LKRTAKITSIESGKDEILKLLLRSSNSFLMLFYLSIEKLPKEFIILVISKELLS
jgi:hypothetical protein